MSKNKHEISLKDAAKMTKAFRDFPLAQLGTLLGGIKGFSFDSDAIQAVLEQDGCESIRFYLAINGILPPKPALVVVGVDANGNDMTAGLVLDESEACPPVCSVNNALNS